MKKQTIWAASKYILGLGVLAWVIWQHWDPPASEGPGLRQALQNPIQIGPFVACAAIYLVAVMLTFFRWYILVRAQDLPLSLFNAFRLGLVGFYFSSFLPSSIGGDIPKAAMIAREQRRHTVAVATVLFDRGVGLWGLVWVVVLLGTFFWATGNPMLLDNPYLRRIVFTSSLLIGASLVVWFGLMLLPARRAEIFTGRLERAPKIGHMLAELWRAVWMYRLKQASVAQALSISILSHCGFVLAFYFAGQIFADPSLPGGFPSVSECFLIVPVGCGIQAIIPVPGGIGVGEKGFGYLYTLVGKPGPAGVIASLAQRVVIWGWSFVGFLVYQWMKPEIVAAEREEAESAPELSNGLVRDPMARALDSPADNLLSSTEIPGSLT